MKFGKLEALRLPRLIAAGLVWAAALGPMVCESVAEASLHAWYSAEEGLADTDAKAESGDQVVRLLDKSGNGRDLVAALPDAQSPVLREDVVTGAKLLEFSGTQALQSLPGWGLLSQPSTIVIAARLHKTSGGYLFDSRYHTQGRQALFAGDSLRLSRWQVWSGEGLVHSDLATTHHMQIHSIVFDGDRTAHYIDGILAAAGPSGKQPMSGFTLGGRHSLSNGHFLQGEIAEVKVFAGALPTAARQAIETEFMERYLPSDLVDVFVSGSDGYHSFRIPVLLTASDGSLLAFAEGRSRRSDQSKNDIVLRRSEDGGESWGPLIVIADHGDHSLNDPTAVRHRATGRIFLFFHQYPYGVAASALEPGFEGEAVHRTFLTWSDDDGLTWNSPEEISRSVKRSAEVTYLGSGPGLGIELTEGPHAGRMVIPFRERRGVYAVFSDDGGATWAFGELAENISPGAANEPQMVEISGGRVLLNARNAGGHGYRKIAISADGGQSWGPMRHDRALIEPECQASVIRYSEMNRDQALHLFVNPATREKGDGGRRLGLLRGSFDDGETWPLQRTVYRGQFGYTGMDVMADGAIGILFEREFGIRWAHQTAADHGKDPMRISFRKVELDWLRQGEDVASPRNELGPRASTEFSDFLEGKSFEATALPADSEPGWERLRGTAGGNPSDKIEDGIYRLRVPSSESFLAWSSASILESASVESGWSIEFRVRIPEAGDAGEPFHFLLDAFLADDPAGSYNLRIWEDRVEWSFGPAESDKIFWEVDNADGWHVFRLTKSPLGGPYQLFRDGRHLGVDLQGGVIPTETRFLWGDWSRERRGGADVDYIRWETRGGYAPPDALPSASFRSWQRSHFGDGPNDPDVAGPLADSLGNGIPNLVKYALGVGPEEAHSLFLPQWTLGESDGVFRLTHLWRPEAEDIEYVVESSTDLRSWNPDPVLVLRERNEDGSMSRTYEAPASAEATSLFMRLRINLLQNDDA